MAPRKLPRPGRLRTLAVCAALAITGTVTATLTGSASAAPGTTAVTDWHRGQTRDVLVNLFEWNWPSVGRECRTVLGPAGYGGVQVAPPQDSLTRAPNADGLVHPWWEVYQPVDYNLTSRMGTEAQFERMVRDCRAAGVKVYVDAVINHMTGQGDTSYGGVHYAHFSYPGGYGAADFHHTPADCPTSDGSIQDFNNYLQVTQCELLGLADLDTSSPSVRAKIAGYLNKLISYGVSGFRVDAAKHVGQADLAAIIKLLHRTADGERPYVALEVPFGGPGRVSTKAFTPVADVLGFDFAQQVHDAFSSYQPTFTGNITDLKVFGEDAGLLPSRDELVFVQNHDTERNGSTLSYKDGATNTLATVFMLAYGFGTPQVYSSFTFATNDDSQPANSAGYVTDTVCGPQWTCLDAALPVRNMVGWHNVAGHAPVTNWWDDGVNLIAFSRGHRAWVALDNATTAGTHTFSTGLPRGRYCDTIHGTRTARGCTGPVVSVDSRGRATVTVPAKSAVALSLADRL